MGAVFYDQISLIYCSIIAPKDIQDRRGLIFCKSKQQYINALDGYLTKVEREDGEYEGQETHKLKFFLREHNSSDTWVLSCGRRSFFTRSILNCLANLDQIGWVRLTPYLSEDPKTGKKFIHGAVRHDINFTNLGLSDSYKVKKKYNWSEIPVLETLQVQLKSGKTKEELDSSARDEFFENLIDELMEKLNNRSNQIPFEEESVKANISF
jgi:hypothetical protein